MKATVNNVDEFVSAKAWSVGTAHSWVVYCKGYSTLKQRNSCNFPHRSWWAELIIGQAIKKDGKKKAGEEWRVKENRKFLPLTPPSFILETSRAVQFILYTTTQIWFNWQLIIVCTVSNGQQGATESRMRKWPHCSLDLQPLMRLSFETTRCS